MEELHQRLAAGDESIHQEPVFHACARTQNQQLVPIALILASLRRRWLRVTVVVCIALGLAAAYLGVTPPRYTASALILIDTKNSGALRENPTTSDIMSTSAKIESQVEIMKSERLLRKLVESEQLVTNPALQPGIVPASFSGFVRMITGQPEPKLDDEAKVLAAARALQKLTTVKRLGITYLLQVEVTLAAPQDAARVANGYARAHIEDQRKLNEEFAKRTGELLHERTQELRQHARAAEEAVEQFKFASPQQGHDAASARVTLKDLESIAQTFRVMHDKFLERSAQALQQQHFVIPDAELISPAFPPAGRSWPRPTMVLPAAAFVGLLIGTLWVLILEQAAPKQQPPVNFTLKPTEVAAQRPSKRSAV